MAIAKTVELPGTQIRQALNIFFEPGTVVELRIPKGEAGPVSGYFDDMQKLATQAVNFDGNAPGIYVTLNPVRPDLLARANNRVRWAKKREDVTSTTDTDIVCRRWLPLDFDPKRPADISSTVEEHEAALSRAREVRERLRGQGWPEPVFADSGNGAHLLYRIDLPNNEDSRKLVERCLKAVAFIYADENIDVDVKVGNAARIWKLYGTLCCKGDNMPDRPHRRSAILETPEKMEPVPRELLERLAAILPEDPKPEPGWHSANYKPFDIEAWISEHGLVVSKTKPWNGGTVYELEECPFEPSHRRTAHIIKSASGALAFGCFHNSCAGKDWHALRDLLEPGWENRKNRQGKRAKKDAKDTPAWFDEEGNFIPPVLAEHILQKEKIIYDRRELYIYRNGVYRPEGEGYIRKLTLDLLEDRFREHRAREVVFYIQTKLYDSVKLDTDPRYINLENGLLDWMADPPRLLSHTPEFYSSIRIPVRYNPEARCPAIDRFFGEVLPADCIDLAEEVFGYCLIPDTRFEKAVMLVGGGENGKSTFLRLLTSFLGKENVSGEALQELAENRFRAAELAGKLANIFPDLENRGLETTALFKALVTGDRISVERKHKDPFQLENKARLLFSANEIPGSRDKSHAYYRRWLIIRFPNTFPPGKRDPGLLDKLTRPEELSGLLNRAIRGLVRLFTNERFSEPESIRAELEKYQQANDTVRGFLADRCMVTEKAFISKRELYDEYKAWCEEGIYRPLSQQKFNERILSLVPSAREDRNLGIRSWRGIGLIEE